MKFLLLMAAIIGLNSCNTLIGMGRDTKLGYQWTKAKIQNSGNGGGAQDPGAPVY